MEVYEVGPRDGLQNESAVVPVEVKAEPGAAAGRRGAAHRRASRASCTRAGCRRRPTPSSLLDLLGPFDGDLLAGVRAPVLVPNARGLERALARGAREVAVFVSATETFAQRNLGRSRADALAMAADVVGPARERGLDVRGYVSMCFGDPWEGDVDVAAVVDTVVALAEQGCTRLSLGDTIGVATPGQVVALLDALDAAGLGRDRLAVHFHDTYGQALSNTLVALQQGVTTVDASAGGLGGCPFAMSATGNLATEDLVWRLHGLGIDTGVDLPALVATSAWLGERIGRAPASRAVTALT
ncbi:hydroxymethylglutaryl-CoA lyase [Angustibacter aerolatus]|uniref:Hydroxymethylglutaryl-CoA lyase n=1 Tax=Angustibacter aerolatus TaxID=1162965 RepID=A0ABQ6JGC3_9ACTN|nr:hydroxymethylglutaryl-CoA lyase [Angustibacter aerolatus]